MRRIAIPAAALLTLAIAGCSQTASTSSDSTSSAPSPSTGAPSSPATTASPSAIATQPASQAAESLGCENITTQTPVGTKPLASTAVRCSLDDMGYQVLAFTSKATTAAALASLAAQAKSSGEAITVAVGDTWIVKAAEGPTVGAPMIASAEKQDGKKVVLG